MRNWLTSATRAPQELPSWGQIQLVHQSVSQPGSQAVSRFEISFDWLLLSFCQESRRIFVTGNITKLGSKANEQFHLNFREQSAYLRALEIFHSICAFFRTTGGNERKRIKIRDYPEVFKIVSLNALSPIRRQTEILFSNASKNLASEFVIIFLKAHKLHSTMVEASQTNQHFIMFLSSNCFDNFEANQIQGVSE